MMPATSTHNPWSTTEIEIALSPLKTFLATSAEHHHNSQQSSRRNSRASSPATLNTGSPEQVQLAMRSRSQSHESVAAQSSVTHPSSSPSPPPRHAREKKPVPDEDSLVYMLMEADRRAQKNRNIALRTKINDLYEEFSAESAILEEYTAIFTKLTHDFDFFKSCKLFQYTPTCEKIEHLSRSSSEALAEATTVAKDRHELISAEHKLALVATIKEVKKISAQLTEGKNNDDEGGNCDADDGYDGSNDTIQALYGRLKECNEILRKINISNI